MGTGESGNYYTSGGSDIVHHSALIHSIDGDFIHDRVTGRPMRLKSGGHAQSNMEIMGKNGIEYNVLETCENGVRLGNVPNHKDKRKRMGTAQTWFPESWTTRDIVGAGEHVASLKRNKEKPDGDVMWGTYKGVRVGAIKTNGRIATVFPDQDQVGTLRRGEK